MDFNCKNASADELWQRGFREKAKRNTQKNCLKEILGKQAENCCIKKEEKIFKNFQNYEFDNFFDFLNQKNNKLDYI